MSVANNEDQESVPVWHPSPKTQKYRSGAGYLPIPDTHPTNHLVQGNFKYPPDIFTWIHPIPRQNDKTNLGGKSAMFLYNIYSALPE